MLEEEKEALLILNKIDVNRLNDKENKAVVIIENLIQKQQKEIEKLKKLTKYSMYRKEFLTLNTKIEKKDKIIDLMAKAMDNIKDVQVCEYCNNNNRYCKDERKCMQGIKQYFEKKVED